MSIFKSEDQSQINFKKKNHCRISLYAVFFLFFAYTGFSQPSPGAFDGRVVNVVEFNSNTSGISLSNSDRFGASVANMGDLDGNGVNDLAVGAREDDAGGPNRGAVHLLYLNADGTLVNTVELNSNTIGITLLDNDWFGNSITNMGDLDGNGVNDLAVGGPLDDAGGSGRGAVHLLYLNADGTLVNTVELNSNTSGITLSNDDRFGFSVTNMGDLDGNGVNDLAVGAPRDDMGSNLNRGAVHLLYLNANGTLANSVELNSETIGIALLDISNNDQFGYSVANIGDLDGNGVNDLVVGVWGDDTGGADRGAAHLLYLNADGTLVNTATFNTNTNRITLSDNDWFGASVVNIGDLDGNGVNDLAVGAPRDDTGGWDKGVVHLLYLNADGTLVYSRKLDEYTAGVDLNIYGWFGNSITNMGDLDGNGVNDLVVGNYFEDVGGVDRGVVHLLYLNARSGFMRHGKFFRDGRKQKMQF